MLEKLYTNLEDVLLKRKSNVRFGGIQPEMVVGLMIVRDVFESHNEDSILTSVVDGVHGAVSYHRAGFAADIRLPRLADIELIASDCRVRLGPEFDVVVESDHLHVEFDVRRQGALR